MSILFDFINNNFSNTKPKILKFLEKLANSIEYIWAKFYEKMFS